MSSRGATALLVTLAVVCLGACGADEPDLDDDAGWRTASAPVDPGGLVWAAGSTVHLSDGTSIDVGGPVRAYVVAGDGVFFVPAESADDVGSAQFTEAGLMFSAPGEEPTDTGFTVAGAGLAASPDGESLAVLDADFDTGEASMLLFDLVAGEKVTSDDGMDTSDIDDPVDHLLEMEVEILGISDDEVEARVVDGDYAYDLTTGAGRPLGDEAAAGEPRDPLVSPDGRARIVQREALGDVVVLGQGDELVPRAGTARWTLSRWVDEDTVLGVAIDGPGRGQEIGPEDTLTLITCAVPSGACREVPGTTGERVVLPLGTRPTTVVGLETTGGAP
jgi:hypothetical protein